MAVDMAEAVKAARVFAGFHDRQKPDWLLTEMMRGNFGSTRLALYDYKPPALLEYSREINHESLSDYDTVILIGTSGAGKTATSLRLAAKDYTVLLVCDPKGNGGSTDMLHLIRFAEDLYVSSGKDTSEVERVVYQELSKLLWFRIRLLQECKSRYLDDFKAVHWTVAQLYPWDVFGSDVFSEFRTNETEQPQQMPSVQNYFKWLVLDEVQVLDSKLEGAFPSRQSSPPKDLDDMQGSLAGRSLLAPFVRTLQSLLVKKLLCGTGLSAASVADAVVSPIKLSTSTAVVGVTTCFDQGKVDDVLQQWGVLGGAEERSKACALFAGRPRQAAFLANEMLANNGRITGTAARDLRTLYMTALGKTHGLDPVNPRRGVFRIAGDDLFDVLQEAAIRFVLGYPGIVRTGGFFAVQHGICTLAPCDDGGSRKRQRQDECIIAEALVVQSFAEPMADIFDRTILKATSHSGVGFAVEDYLALRYDVLLNAVKAAATKGVEKFNIPCHRFVKDWRYLDAAYFVQIVERCSESGKEMEIMQLWLQQKRSGVIMPSTTHGADLILLAWDADMPLVTLVQSKSGVSDSTPAALLTLLLPYTEKRAKGMTVKSKLGKSWERFLVAHRCLVAYVVFKPLEGSKMRAVEWKNGRLVVIVNKNSWRELAGGLKLGIENLSKFKNSAPL
jgi:hypothetical protein